MRLARACFFCAVFGAACQGTGEIGLDITLPRGLAGKTVWFEVGAFKDATCQALAPMLRNGVPEGSTRRVAFRRDERQTPVFGDIPNGPYSFAAVARDEDCAIVAMGCTEIDLASSSTIGIDMQEIDKPTGKCTPGASCQAARCVPANDNSNPSVGAGCSLELVGAGPLPTPSGGTGTYLSAPTIAATPTGFVVAYREIDPSGSGGRVKIQPIDPSGGALEPLRPELTPCAEDEPTDGVGLIVNGDNALLALAKAPCTGSSAELQLLNFKTTPQLGKFVVSQSGKLPIRLGAAHPVATRPQGSLLVFAEGGVGRIASVNPEQGIISPPGCDATRCNFGGEGVTDTWIAASQNILALLAVGSGAPPATTLPDGGPIEPDGEPAADSTLRLLITPSGIAPEQFVSTAPPTNPIIYPGRFASLAALAARVIVVSDGNGPEGAITFRAFDGTNTEATARGGFSFEDDEDNQSEPSAVDVALLGDRAFFAALRPGAIELHAYGNATTTIAPLAHVAFGREPRISAISTVRDGGIAVAATDKRVAVTWTISKKLEPNDGAGGYAVFACTQ